MPITTVSVTCQANRPDGTFIAGGKFRFLLSSADTENGLIVPREILATANSSGVVVANLWPNSLGAAGTQYRVMLSEPNGGTIDLGSCTVPTSACNLHAILGFGTAPTLDQATVAKLAAQTAAAASSASATQSAASATNAAASSAAAAGSATAAQSSATSAAGSVSAVATSATNATNSATAAGNSATAAAASNAAAGTSATNAAASATDALASKSAAATSATNSATSATSAQTSATNAATSATTATTKASETATSAANAATSATAALASKNAAATSESNSQGSATSAATQATNAGNSATSAQTSATTASTQATNAASNATNASGSASTATTQASTATTQAAIATTKAGEAATSATTASTQATIATTQATAAGISATNASNSESNAASSATSASTSAAAAATSATNAATSATNASTTLASSVRWDQAQTLTAPQSLQARENIGAGTLATQDANSAAITGGAINGTTVGSTTAAAGSFTTLTTSANAVISDNSANAALRITQVGAGNAILVEDSANPDATPFVVNGNGEVAVGHTAVTAYIPGIAPNFQVLGTDNKSSSTALMRYSADTFGCSVLINKSRGAIGAQGVVSSGDTIGTIYFAASDGTNPIAAASIASSVDGTPGTNDMPGRLTFSTTADGASSPTERMRITNDGRITTGTGIGAGSSATQITIGGTLVSASNVTRAVSNIGTAPSTSTTEFSSFLSSPSTTAAAYTITNMQHFGAAFSTLGASSAITNQYGFFANSNLTVATNNYGFYGNIASGTNRFNFYANGTAANVFAGTTSLGGLVGAESLRVTPTASAVNYVSVFGAVTLAQPSIIAQGSDTNIGLSLASKGGSGLLLYTNSGANLQLVVAHTASAVNYLQATGAATGNSPTISAQGSDANITLNYDAKGTGSHSFRSAGGLNQFQIASTTSAVNYVKVSAAGSGSFPQFGAAGETNVGMLISGKGDKGVYLQTASTTQVLVSATASAVNYLNLTGAVTTGAPVISALGSDTNISLTLTAKGTGKVISTTDATINGATVGKGGGSQSNNTAIGSGALFTNTTGNQNTGVGFNALYFTNTGIFNTAVGTSALTCNTVASSQTAVGYQALINATTAVATFGAITAGSGYTNGTYTTVAMTPVSGATFITYPTVTVVVAGGVVTTVTLVTGGIIASSTAATVLTVAAALLGGTGSGFSISVATFVTGANNTAVGYQTLTANTAGSSNTALGFQAGNTLVSGGNNLILGNGAAVSTTTVSNEITLGNSSITAFRIPGLTITAGASALTIGSQFAVTNTASAVNYINATGGVTGASPTISAGGSDTNIDLALTPKGTGVLRFGTHTVGILAQSGYITIKDAAGTTRNLLVG
jgi:hypothetical protein